MMERSRRRTAAALAIALLCGAAACTTETAEPTTATERVPATLSDDDRVLAGRVLGANAADAAAATATLPPALRVPAGATTFVDGVWEFEGRRIGIVRLFTYDPPIDIPKRPWQRATSYVGSTAPTIHTDAYGVEGLTRLMASLTVAGEVVEVTPQEYADLVDPSVAPPPPGASLPPGD